MSKCPTSIQWLDDSPATPCVLPKGHDEQHQYGVANWHPYCTDCTPGLSCQFCEPAAMSPLPSSAARPPMTARPQLKKEKS